VTDASSRPAAFFTTRWSVVLAVGASDEPARVAALEELCTTYWYPLYAYLRRTGRRSEDAADLVQQFFAQLLARRDLERADPTRGRFRSWLLTALRNFAANERERQRTLKRGGGRTPLSFDAERADTRYASEPADRRTPEQHFERVWAQSVLATALERLADEQRRIGRGAHFEALLPALSEQDDAEPHAAVARRLEVSENALKVALHRLRKRLGELVRDEVAATLSDPGELDDELGRLFEALRSPSERS
jgi:RNA polymerase sigma factor (sigma-70 family)